MTTNDVTGDKLVSKYSSKYYENYDTIFGKKEKVAEESVEESNVEDNERNKMLKPEDFIAKGYRKYSLNSFDRKRSSSDYIFSKSIDNELGKKYTIVVYVYEHYNKDYYSPEMQPYGFQPDVQFREGKHPTINLQLILDDNCSVQDMEDTFESLYLASQAGYESYYD